MTSLAGSVDSSQVAPAPAPASPASVAEGHNAFLDFVRTVAIVRVLVWHTYGYAWISYFVASMPAMFFVAGSLMAQSLERGGARKVLISRFRRLLIPLWAFGVVAVGIMLVHAHYWGDPGETVNLRRLVFWVFPIWDPQGSVWGVTWWAVLWYMRCLTWLILLSPILLWLFHRLSAGVLLLPLGLLAFLEYWRESGHFVYWQFEDAALFGVFWLLGFCHNAKLLAPFSTALRAALTAFFGACAFFWVTTQDVPGYVVNASYPSHLFVGLAWLFFAATFERPVTAFASRGAVGRAIAWINDRAFTIYLWHAAGLFTMYQLLWVHDRPGWLREVAALPIVLLVTFACMLGFGWIEDISARRPVHFAPRAGRVRRGHEGEVPKPGIAGRLLVPFAAVLGFGTIIGAMFVERYEPAAVNVSVARVVPPSGVGLAIRTQNAVITDTAPPRAVAPISGGPVTAREMQALLDAWYRTNDIPGIAVGVRVRNGESWSGASGMDLRTGQGLLPDTAYNTASVTKTFTVAMILQLVESGDISLDDRLSSFFDFPHGDAITIRNLIQHTSGLMATDDVPANIALEAATEVGLSFEPGTGFEYSSPGYFLLGLVIEKVVGKPFTVALHQRLLDPLGLRNTFMDEELYPLDYSTHPEPIGTFPSGSGVLRSSTGPRELLMPDIDYYGWLWSSAGIWSTVVDLSAWAFDLWGSDRVVSAEMLDQMTNFLGPEFQYAGLGTYPFCPCWREDSRIHGERWGHNGLSGVLEFDPVDRVAIAIYGNGVILDERLIVAYDDLSKSIRDTLRGREVAFQR